MGVVLGKLNEIQQEMHIEVCELARNIEKSVLRPLADYQVNWI
jgi:hypothetical protein